MAATLTPGQTHDSRQFESLLAAGRQPFPSRRGHRRPTRLAADRAYHAQRIRHWLRRHGIRAVIPPRTRPGKPRPGRPISYNRTQYRGRNVIERCIGWLKECRAVGTRYEKLALNYLGIVHLAIIQRYLRLLC